MNNSPTRSTLSPDFTGQQRIDGEGIQLVTTLLTRISSSPINHILAHQQEEEESSSGSDHLDDDGSCSNDARIIRGSVVGILPLTNSGSRKEHLRWIIDAALAVIEEDILDDGTTSN